MRLNISKENKTFLIPIRRHNDLIERLNINKANKEQLITYAEVIGLDVTNNLTVAQIKEKIIVAGKLFRKRLTRWERIKTINNCLFRITILFVFFSVLLFISFCYSKIVAVFALILVSGGLTFFVVFPFRKRLKGLERIKTINDRLSTILLFLLALSFGLCLFSPLIDRVLSSSIGKVEDIFMIFLAIFIPFTIIDSAISGECNKKIRYYESKLDGKYLIGIGDKMFFRLLRRILPKNLTTKLRQEAYIDESKPVIVIVKKALEKYLKK